MDTTLFSMNRVFKIQLLWKNNPCAGEIYVLHRKNNPCYIKTPQYCKINNPFPQESRHLILFVKKKSRSLFPFCLKKVITLLFGGGGGRRQQAGANSVCDFVYGGGGNDEIFKDNFFYWPIGHNRTHDLEHTLRMNDDGGK